MIYTLNNPTEEYTTQELLVEEATREFNKKIHGDIHANFIIKNDVYIITTKGRVYKSTTLSRNEAELAYFGEIGYANDQNVSSLKNALRIISRVTR
tara:strand:- start:6613 stop:6900 length:288 start_codon:yes stop_codon:yes gene_type:complete